MKKITSQDNKIFKMCLQLENRKYRERLGKYIIEGPNLIREAFMNEIQLDALIVDEDMENSVEIKQLCKDYDTCATTLVSDSAMLLENKLFRKISQTEHSQGIFGVVSKPNFEEKEFFNAVEERNGNVLVLDRLQDPGNVGTIIRTADATNYGGIMVLKGTADIFSPKVVRACTGSLFRVPILFVDTPEYAMKILRGNGKRVISTGFETHRYYYEADIKRNIGLVMGNEGNGICPEFKAQADEIIKIPMSDKTESLNASVAAAILMYESMREQ